MAFIFENNTLRNIFGSKLTQVATLPVDVTVREVHELPTTVTSKPVEDGSKISDNAINEAARVSIDGILTDDLIGDSWEDKWRSLQEIRDAREPFTVVTAIAVYENMLFERLTVNRSASTGGALFFSAQLKNVRIIESQTTGVPAQASSNPQAYDPKQDAGKKQPQPQTEQRERDLIKTVASWF